MEKINYSLKAKIEELVLNPLPISEKIAMLNNIKSYWLSHPEIIEFIDEKIKVLTS